MAIIDQVNAHGPVLDRWSFGGGTALMLSISHRESHDIDLFIDDPQVLPLLNPQTQDYVLDLMPVDYETDGLQALKIVFAGIGEIDFICSDPLTSPYAETMDVLGHLAMVETPEEIIAKKIFHRGGRMQPRDMFDIAAVLQCRGSQGLLDALQPYHEKCQQALVIAETFDNASAKSTMSQLAIREGFEDLPERAQGDTAVLLRSIVEAPPHVSSLS